MRKVEETFDVLSASKFMVDEVALDVDEKLKVVG